MRRCVLRTVLAFSLFGVGPLVGAASACPMCKAANETQPALPRAYMFSILFMLSVPALVVTGFSVGFYRLAQQTTGPTDEELAALDAELFGPGDDQA